MPPPWPAPSPSPPPPKPPSASAPACGPASKPARNALDGPHRSSPDSDSQQAARYIDIERLTVRYGASADSAALEDLDLAIARGELFVLLGGSGSGKTTLLRTLAGFVHPAAGRITLAGRDITALPPHQRPVNTMFQSYALFPHMTVADNIAFGLRRQGLPRAQRDSRVAELLTLVRMEAFAARRPDALSGGQRQRVALARALAPRPDLLLLDEPLSALDRGLRDATRAELVRIQRELGTTFVMVTHDQEEALSMATRIGLLEAGRLAQTGTPADLYERPATASIAAFMGVANIVPAHIHAPGLLALPTLGTFAQADTATLPPTLQIALRPERLRLTPTSTADTTPNTVPNSVRGVVTETAYRGALIDHRIRIGTTTLLVSVPPDPGGDGVNPASRAGPPATPPGTPVTISWPPSACIPLPT